MISTIAHSYEHSNINPPYTVDSFTSKLSFLFIMVLGCAHLYSRNMDTASQDMNMQNPEL